MVCWVLDLGRGGRRKEGEVDGAEGRDLTTENRVGRAPVRNQPWCVPSVQESRAIYAAFWSIRRSTHTLIVIRYLPVRD